MAVPKAELAQDKVISFWTIAFQSLQGTEILTSQPICVLADTAFFLETFDSQPGAASFQKV